MAVRNVPQTDCSEVESTLPIGERDDELGPAWDLLHDPFQRVVTPSLVHSASHVCDFIGHVYNRQRLYSALAYTSPMEFEQADQVAWLAGQ